MNPEAPDFVMSPLADPVVSAMYANAEVAGLAMESLIRVVLESDNEQLKGKIQSLTPQSTYASARKRGCRVDIKSETDSNEKIIAEIQVKIDRSIMKRDLFAASHIFTETSTRGDTPSQMAMKMPRVIFINILGYNIREDNTEMIQPFKMMYTKEPKMVAIPNFSGYNVQLPRILEMEADFSNGLYCWAYTLYTAHVKSKTVQEVLAMTPVLQEYAELDKGYRQFCDRYQLV